jgi:hypothetical protein
MKGAPPLRLVHGRTPETQLANGGRRDSDGTGPVCLPGVVGQFELDISRG